MTIDTEALSTRYRAASVDLSGKRLLITNFRNTEQEKDFSKPPNCSGVGRIRHFRRTLGNSDWPPNPLPIDPACKVLGLQLTDMIRAQVFQNAVCNWRCWYCFVPFDLLNANPDYSEWMSPAILIDRYLDQPNPPPMIDLTGGQPDLIPEWVPWMMAELKNRGLDRQVYPWSDDNLSNDYFWRYLSEADIELIATYPNYGRVCCFKGFNVESFAFNTRAEPALFEQQFELMKKLLNLGIDLYSYATFTVPSRHGIEEDMRCFVDRLQMLDENLPLRTVPLQIQEFTPVKQRLNSATIDALHNQQIAIEAWLQELEQRFSSKELSYNIADIPLDKGNVSRLTH
ncbi:MAG: radical SAM protein [Symploca sp. SIO1A3]|nr:radical SAM protein [Symploca sp. SIO1A3]